MHAALRTYGSDLLATEFKIRTFSKIFFEWIRYSSLAGSARVADSASAAAMPCAAYTLCSSLSNTVRKCFSEMSSSLATRAGSSCRLAQ